MATVTSKALFRGAATTNTATTLYTVPSATTAIITNIAVTNAGSSDYTFTIGIDGVDIHTATSILANSTVYIDCKQVLAATKVLTGGASNTNVKFHISGVEVA
jgi:phage-related protein